MTVLRDAVKADYESIVRLNAAEERQTSAMSLMRLKQFVLMASYCRVALIDGAVAGFLLAFGEGSAYENDNYAWFSERLSDFVYVDRIVVGAEFGRKGIGNRLYSDLFSFARDRGIGTIACEYNIEPPNPASRAFHDKFGFREIGTQWVSGRTKQVSLQSVEI